MRVKWKRSAKRLIWKFKPWARAKQLEERCKEAQDKVRAKDRHIKVLENALQGKRHAYQQLLAAYDKAKKELQRQRCNKIKHADKPKADKAAARLFNQTSHVMESYQCFSCPKNPDTGEKWWHIRHAMTSERGKYGQSKDSD